MEANEFEITAGVFKRLPAIKGEYPTNPERQTGIDLVDGAFRDAILEIVKAMPESEDNKEIRDAFISQAWKAYILAMAAFGQHVLWPQVLAKMELPELRTSTPKKGGEGRR